MMLNLSFYRTLKIRLAQVCSHWGVGITVLYLQNEVKDPPLLFTQPCIDYSSKKSSYSMHPTLYSSLPSWFVWVINSKISHTLLASSHRCFWQDRGFARRAAPIQGLGGEEHRRSGAFGARQRRFVFDNVFGRSEVKSQKPRSCNDRLGVVTT